MIESIRTKSLHGGTRYANKAKPNIPKGKQIPCTAA